MKNLFKCFFALLALFALASCDSKRPGTSENFVIDISGTSILKNAEVTLYSEGKEVAKTTTDENGKFEMKDVSSATGLLISVCKGAFHSVASEKDVDFTGCLENYIPAAQEDVSAVVDFLSTFIVKYDETLEEKTALEEWSEYLSMTTSPAPELQEALTDATKRYLWQQGLSKLAEQVSQANNITPESMFSTENLFNLLVADLVDDSIINGSTKTKIGNMDINALVLKNYIADAIPKVSETFSAADLSEWTDKIRYSDAKFLGGEGKGSTNNEIEISLDIYPEGSKGAHPDFYSGNVIVEAAAEPAELVFSLKCYAGESEITNDLEEKNQFEGSFSTLEIEDDTILKVRCDASDGVSIKSVEKEITVNNDAPITTATLFEAGTNIVTGTEENPAKSKVDLKVEAKHAKYNIDEVVCSLENYTLKNTATANYQFTAAIDTTELPEGKNTLKCTATMNQNRFSSEFDFIVRNTVVVTVKPYIVNPLSEIKSVDIDCGENFKEHYTAPENISLKRGQICTITVSGGKFQSVTLESIREFGSSLSAVVIPESDADIIITPATTIDEIIYSSRVSAGEDAAETFEKSKDSLLKHFSKAFSWKDEPKNTQSMDAATKYYILLAGLENLAYFMEMQISTNHGAYNIGNIIDLLRDDYSDQTFDGAKNGSKLVFGTENKFELDANFFRYYYATAIKRFLASDFNTTGITNIGSILNQISTNSDQYLFPANSETIAIESDGPIITIDSFKNLRPYREEDGDSEDYIDGELAAYMPLGEETSYLATTGERQPYFAKAFVLNFTVKSNNGNYIDLNSVKISGNSEDVFGFKRLSPAEIAGDGFTDEDTEFSFLVEYDGHNQPKVEKELEFTVSAEDVAFNGGSATVKAFLDSKEPTIDLLGDKTATNGADSFFITSRVSDNALAVITYCLDKVATEIDGETGEEVATETEIKCKNRIYEATSDIVTLDIAAAEIKEYIETAAAEGTITETDGDYVFRITATDRAGNSYVGTKNFVYDTTPPAIPSFEIVSLDENAGLLGWSLAIPNDSIGFYISSETEDISSWRLIVKCGYYDGQSVEFTDIKTSGDVTANQAAIVTNLLKPQNPEDLSVCEPSAEVCDEVGNCNSTGGGSYFFIDNQPPQLIKIDGNKYDKDAAILANCVAQQSSGGGIIIPTMQCGDVPNCTTDGGAILLGTRQAQILVKYQDNTEAVKSVKIRSDQYGWTRECTYTGSGGTCDDKYYCNIEGSETGNNVIFYVSAEDYLGNVSVEEPISVNFTSQLVSPKLKLTKTFFTENSSSVVSWTANNNFSYSCKITKDGDDAENATCSNGTTITGSGKLWGSGSYKVTLTSTNSAGESRTDSISFKYFKTSDLTATFTPIKNQVLKNQETFRFQTKIESKDNLAQISKIEYYLYGLYKDGESYDSQKYLFLTYNFSSPISNQNKVVSTTLNFDAYGQFRNLRAKIFFADGTSIIKDTTQSAANSFLLCKLGTNEGLEKITLSYVNSAYRAEYKKPACFGYSDYSINLVTYAPGNCNGGIEATQTITTDDLNPQFLISSNTVFIKNHHSHGNCFVAYCAGKSSIDTLAKNTAFEIIYNYNKAEIHTVSAGLSDTWTYFPISWKHGGCGSCTKCNGTENISCGQTTKITKKLH